jgi:hypothetical protein
VSIATKIPYCTVGNASPNRQFDKIIIMVDGLTPSAFTMNGHASQNLIVPVIATSIFDFAGPTRAPNSS